LTVDHEDCKLSSTTPIAVTTPDGEATPVEIAAQTIDGGDSNPLTSQLPYTPTLAKVAISPDFCLLISSWSSATIDTALVTAT